MSKCNGCGVSFEPNYPEQKFHDHACFLSSLNRDSERQSQKGKKGGQIRGEQLRGIPGNWNRGGTGRQGTREPGSTRVDVQGYVVLWNGQHQHRAVAEEVLGRKLHPREVVHHEDRNKQNNDPENLIVFVSQSQHARHHKLDHCGLPKCDCYGVRLKEVVSDVQ